MEAVMHSGKSCPLSHFLSYRDILNTPYGRLQILKKTRGKTRRVTHQGKQALWTPALGNLCWSSVQLSRLRIYWQKDNQVVWSFISGNREVWPQYKNRTVVDITNLSLVILRPFLSDRGTYTCVVQRNERGTFELKHLASVKLSIRADYPVPNITEFGNSSVDIKRIMCLTSGGFPEPQLSWLENGNELSGINTIIFQDPESELYTVSSKLDFNMTYNHTIVCQVSYGDAQVSKNFTWEKPPEVPPDRNQLNFEVKIITIVLVLPIVIIVFICLYHRGYFRRRNGTSGRENNSIYLGPVEASAEQTI
ncbi:T-lymphocyte activation antigen CD80 isoform X1 [Sigmodon hispidus]